MSQANVPDLDEALKQLDEKNKDTENSFTIVCLSPTVISV